MRPVALHRHPASPCEAVECLEASVARTSPDTLALVYRLAGDTSRLRIPGPDPAGRRDGLWRHTCFELFVRGEGEGYCELNFSPSGAWAAYRFAAYRDGMTALELHAPPRIAAHTTPSALVVDVCVSLPMGVLGGARARLGLSAVVEDAAGALSYWALAHAGRGPDFHAAQSFALELPASACDA